MIPFPLENHTTAKEFTTMSTVQSSHPNTSSTVKSSISTKELALTGMSAAILAVISQISLPMPTGVPITIQVFGVVLVSTVLGWRLGSLAALVYVLLGAVGLPIFANFKGGLSAITGLTGGYIWSWPLMALICGTRLRTGSKTLNTFFAFFLPIIGTLVNETMGGLQWAALAENMSVLGVFTYSMTMFIPKDIVLTIIAVIVGMPIRRILSRQL